MHTWVWPDNAFKGTLVNWALSSLHVLPIAHGSSSETTRGGLMINFKSSAQSSEIVNHNILWENHIDLDDQKKILDWANF